MSNRDNYIDTLTSSLDVPVFEDSKLSVLSIFSQCCWAGAEGGAKAEILSPAPGETWEFHTLNVFIPRPWYEWNMLVERNVQNLQQQKCTLIFRFEVLVTGRLLSWVTCSWVFGGPVRPIVKTICMHHGVAVILFSSISRYIPAWLRRWAVYIFLNWCGFFAIFISVGIPFNSSTTLTLKKFDLTSRFALGFTKFRGPEACLMFTILLAANLNHWSFSTLSYPWSILNVWAM